MFQIFLSNNSKKFLKKCDNKIRERLNKLFEVLKEEPVPAKLFDLTKIEGSTHSYRIRLSSHRVTYFISWDKKEINIMNIERRDESTYKH